MKTNLGTETASDVQLVEWSLTGDRDAFGKIVQRYQSLVCSITYGATGSLSLSEDIAQETFLTAWRKLEGLSDATRLRAWLCGIARNLTQNFLRRGQREPATTAESMEAIGELPAPEPSPASQAVSREEEAILWRALERIPDTYREPLILFYREHRSIERVAEELELSEDAVKQRLARGRKMLADEVASFVEGTLERTAPGVAFSQAVVAALPLAATSAGAGGTAAATKSAGLFAWLFPLVGILGGITAQCLIARSAPTERERRAKLRFVIVIWAIVLTWAYPGQIAMRMLASHLKWTDPTLYAVMAVYWWGLAVVAVTAATVGFRRDLGAAQEGTQPVRSPIKRETRLTVTVGMYLCYFWGFIYMARVAQDRLWTGIIAAIMVVLGLAYYFHLRGKTGLTARRTAIGHVMLVFGVILVLLNLRLDAWLASYRGSSLAEIHQLLPVWAVHALALALVMWVILLVVLTRPKRKLAR